MMSRSTNGIFIVAALVIVAIMVVLMAITVLPAAPTAPTPTWPQGIDLPDKLPRIPH